MFVGSLTAEEGQQGLYPGSPVPRPKRSQRALGHLLLVFGVQEVAIVFSPPILEALVVSMPSFLFLLSPAFVTSFVPTKKGKSQ